MGRIRTRHNQLIYKKKIRHKSPDFFWVWLFFHWELFGEKKSRHQLRCLGTTTKEDFEVPRLDKFNVTSRLWIWQLTLDSWCVARTDQWSRAYRARVPSLRTYTVRTSYKTGCRRGRLRWFSTRPTIKWYMYVRGKIYRAAVLVSLVQPGRMKLFMRIPASCGSARYCIHTHDSSTSWKPPYVCFKMTLISGCGLRVQPQRGKFAWQCTCFSSSAVGRPSKYRTSAAQHAKWRFLIHIRQQY